MLNHANLGPFPWLSKKLLLNPVTQTAPFDTERLYWDHGLLTQGHRHWMVMKLAKFRQPPSYFFLSSIVSAPPGQTGNTSQIRFISLSPHTCLPHDQNMGRKGRHNRAALKQRKFRRVLAHYRAVGVNYKHWDRLRNGPNLVISLVTQITGWLQIFARCWL